MKNNQRIGAKSNADVGRKFEILAKEYLEKNGHYNLKFNYKVKIGISKLKEKKEHRFDLGGTGVLVECKSHTWTKGQNVPSVKI